jgi:carboxypeptidase PM20D1
MEFIDRFREAITIKTDWPKGAQPGDRDAEASLERFQEFLVQAYPAFHKTAERRVLNPYSVVYRWPGQGKGRKKPALFLGHYDVVPVEKEKWTVDPFGAEIKDGFIYGRGTLDMKGILIGMVEAAEALCGQGFRPQEDVWFAFGGDEERSGFLGAQKAAEWFAGQGLRFSWILDEGTPIGKGLVPGIEPPLALLGIEEKGYLSLNLIVRQQPGHASRPPKVQAAAVLGQALARLSKKPFPFVLTPTVEAFFSRLAPLSSRGRAWALSHARLLGGIFFKAAAENPDIASMLRTTMAMTELEGSAADNVMPSAVRATINLRLIPPWTTESAAAYIKQVIRDDRVEISPYARGANPNPANPEHAKCRGPGWEELSKAIGVLYPGPDGKPSIPILPFVMVAATDSKHYASLGEGIFRFSPHTLDPLEIALVHGHDERISLENLRQGQRFYQALLEQL